MSEIKTALEVALERSTDVKIDKRAVSKERHVRGGKVSAGRFLSDGNEETLKKEIGALSGEERKWFKEGLCTNLLANINLPRSEEELGQLDLIGRGLRCMVKDGGAAGNLNYLMGRYRELFRQYLENVRSLESQLRAKWDDRLRQKEEQLRQQIGYSVRLTAEQDPDFGKILGERLAELDRQYAEVLNQSKKKIRELL